MYKEYIPHTFQKQFHRSRARFRTLIAGRRGGKSLAGVIESLWWADNGAQQKNRPTKGWIVAPTYAMLQDINIPMIFEWIPPASIKRWREQEKKLTLINGSEIAFRSADDENRLRGVGLDWMWLDEASYMKRVVWEVLNPALADRQGIAWVTTTPRGQDWVYKTFYLPALRHNPDFEVWQFRTVDNPAIDKSIVEKARGELSEQMFRQEYEASFEKFTGLVYSDFDPKTHVRDFKMSTDDMLFIGIDTGFTNPTAMIAIFEKADHSLWVVDEVYETKLTASDIVDRYSQLLNRVSQKYNGGIPVLPEVVVIDPASRAVHQTSSVSIFDQIREESIARKMDVPLIPGNNDVIAGISRVTKMIRNEALYVSSSCTKTLDELSTYSWYQDPEDMNSRERPKKVKDHLADALRYVVQNRPDRFDRPIRDMYGKVIAPLGLLNSWDDKVDEIDL